MNANKRLKPNLLDPILEKKIIKTLKPPQEDYWAPTKTTFQSFYQKYITPNWGLVILIILFIMFLLYRYITIKRDRDEKTPTTCVNGVCNRETATKKEADTNTKEYTDAFVNLYTQQKENAREPKPVKRADENKPKMAYPMYPYKGGSLVSAGSR